MEITVDITREDFGKFNTYVMRNNKAIKRFNLIIPIFLIVVFLLKNLKDITNITFVVMLIIAVFVIYYVVMFFLNPLMSFAYKFIPLKDGAMLGEHKFRIADEGFWEIKANNETLTKWEGVKSIVENEKYIYIFIDAHMAHVIPKRCFNSEQEYLHFMTLLKQNVEC